MAIRKNADGSVTVGIIKSEPKAKPETKAEQPKKKGKAKNKGEG